MTRDREQRQGGKQDPTGIQGPLNSSVPSTLMVMYSS